MNSLKNISAELLGSILDCIMPLLDRKVTVFFTSGSTDPMAMLRAVDGVLASQARVVLSKKLYTTAQDFRKALGERVLCNLDEIQKAVAESELVLVPILTRNTLAKVATGIADGTVSYGMAQAFMRGKPLIAVKDDYHPESPVAKEMGISKNPAYNRMLLDHEAQIVEFGAKLIDSGEFTNTVKQQLYPWIFAERPSGANEISIKGVTSSQQRRLETEIVTYKDLQDLSPGAEVSIPRKAVITPLARDYIAENRLQLITDHDNQYEGESPL